MTTAIKDPQYSDCIHENGSTTPTEPVPALQIIRKNQKDLTEQERERFKTAYTALIDEGFMTIHVGHHADMSHQMHGGMSGEIGYQRFLPWHRIYLWILEQELQRVDSSVSIPYWKWTVDQEFPSWLAGFLPSGITRLNGDPINLTRNIGARQIAPHLPSETEINTIMQYDRYFPFASHLEGVPVDPNQRIAAHNQVHAWVGGTMNNLFLSPADPVFWMHHAQVDRLWHLWQQSHPNQHPTLTGARATLDPWPEKETDARHISDLGYTFA